MSRWPIRMLVVEHEPRVRVELTRLLGSRGYECTAVPDIGAARHALTATHFMLVLCDIQAPGGSGLDLLRDIATELPNTATVAVTGVDDSRVAWKAMEQGAYGYVVKPFRPNEILINVVNALQRLELEKERRGHAIDLESKLTERSWALNRAIAKLQSYEDTDDLPWFETMERLARALSLRDEETGRHIERVGVFCELLSERCTRATWAPHTIRLAGMLHDVGKIGVPDAILHKPRALTPVERRMVQRHCELGYQLLTGSRSPILTLSATIALTHHEWWDGTGYPHRLHGDQIPLEGRITAIADVFDALTSERVYRGAFEVDEALEMMTTKRGLHFDPLLLDVFVEAADDVRRVRAELPDECLHAGVVRVLVVDSHQLFANGMVSLLGSEDGIDVVGQSSEVPDAVAAVHEKQPDVVVLDWDLTGGAGAGAARTLLDAAPGAKVVILTAEADRLAVSEAMEAGCSGILDKERGLEEVVAAIKTAHLGEVTIPIWRLSVANRPGEHGVPPTNLTKRELEILGLLAEGLSNAALAERLSITSNTVRNHVQRILEKLGAHSKLEAVTTSLRTGLVKVPVGF